MSLIAQKLISASGATEETDDDFNLVTALYHFDGSNGAQNNTLLDSSSESHTVTRNADIVQGTFSPFSADEGKWSAEFPIGVASNKIECSASADFAFGTGAFTIEAWVYVTADTYSYSRVFNIGPYYSSANSVGLAVHDTDNSNKISFFAYACSTSARVCVSTSATPENEWFHVAVSRDGTGDFRLFVNGNLDSTSTIYRTVNISSLGNPVLAIGGATDRTVEEPFEGFISNFRVIKGSALYTSSFTPSTSPLTAVTNTKLLTCCSNRFRDKSTSAHRVAPNASGVNHMTSTILPKVQPFSPFAPSSSYSAASKGGSGFFDQTSDCYFDVSDATDFDFGTGDYTVEMWVYPTTTFNTNWAMAFNTIGVNQYWAWTDGGGTESAAGLSSYPSGNYSGSFDHMPNRFSWSHVVFQNTSGTENWYVNGVRVYNATNNPSFSASATGVRVGLSPAYASQFFYGGYISDVRVLKGSNAYSNASTLTVPTAPLGSVTNTKLLTNFTNAAIFDQTGKTNVQTVSTAQLDTAVKKFGTASAEFSGNTTDKLVAIFSGITIGTGDFTIEFWVYFDAISDGNVYTLLDGRTSGDTSNLMWAQEAYGTWSNYDGAGSNLNEGWDSSTFSTGTWYHIAQTRESSVSRFFVNGTKTSGNLTDTTNYDSQTYHIGGRYAVGGNSTNGYIDELRITKGKARYTSNFTVPTEEFLNR
jgi:hypothetical protein